MKNLLSLLAALGLTATAATTVIACGSPKNSVVIKKTALKDLNLKTRLKNSVKNQQAAFDSFIEMNPEVSDLHDSVQVIAFDVPDYNKEGSLEVEAKTNTKYSGTLTITIPELTKTDITGLITNTTIQGTENMTEAQAFQAFLEANNSWTNLNDYVEVDSFAAATYTSNGSLTIKAKTNTAYTGSVMVRINAIGQTSLIDLHLKTLLSTSVTDQQAAFDLFIKMNPEVSDLSDDVQIVGFTAPDYNQTGSLEVEAKPSTNYSGTLTITIPELNKTDITGLVTNTTIQGTENMTVDQAFQAFLEANNSWTNLGDYVEVDSFAAATYTSNGSLTIKAKTNTAYTGSIEIRINAIGQTSLNDLHLKTLLSTSVTDQQAAFDLFIKMNPEVSDLRDNLEITSFTAPEYNKEGSLEVQAKTNTKYSGTLTITISELIKTDITGLINNRTIKGTALMTVDQAFQAFLEANNSWTNLNDYVEVDSFTAATYTSNGALTIKAKPNTAYTGSIEIRINAIGQTSLNDLDLKTLLSTSVTDQQAAFDLFIKMNPEVSDLRDNLEITSFTAPEYNKEGSLEVQAKTNTKYSGTLTITISELIKTDITGLINNRTIKGTALMTVDQAFQAFLSANSSFIGLDTVVDYDADSFIAPSSTTDGSLTISAKPNTAYTGTLIITITKLTNVVDERNFVDIVEQISKNNQLVLRIPSGTTKGDGGADSTYVQSLKQSFIRLVVGLGYQINLQDMVITQQWFDNGSGGYEGEAPSNEQLDSDYYDWHTTKGISIGGYMVTASGEIIPFEFHFLKCEIIIGQQR